MMTENRNIIKHEGKDYLRVGDKAILIDHYDADGKPVITDTWSEETPNASGGQDCTVHVRCLQIKAKPEQPS